MSQARRRQGLRMRGALRIILTSTESAGQVLAKFGNPGLQQTYRFATLIYAPVRL